MKAQDIDKLMQTIVSMKEHKAIKNRIDRVELRYLRGFQKDSIIEFQLPISVIVGKNGSGKSTILRSIQLLGKGCIPQNEFFEIEFDHGDLKGTEIEYHVDGKIEKLSCMGKNKWRSENEVEHVDMTVIRPKAIVGAIDKSFLYDNIGQHVNKAKQVEYLIKQSKKIQQKPETSGKKKRKILSSNELSEINYVLQSNYSSIEFVKHRFFGGTWATTVLFKKENDENVFCEYNAGSGEFLVANIIDQILCAKRESVVLIDEPEVSLHPGAQKRLLKFILKSIIAKKMQVIISTHSRDIVENLLPQAIVCVEKQNTGVAQVKNNVLPEQAFLEIEVTPDVKQIIVEDDMACSIIQSVLKAEKLDDLLKVIYIPGGASNLKKHIIPAFSKTNVNNQFIWFDGDQYKKEVPDFTEVLEKDKNEKYYKCVFKECVGIEAKNIDWCPDGNSKAGRINKNQEINMIIQYLEYFKKNVFFLPKMIPEDIVYDEDYIKMITMTEVIPDSVLQAKNSKEKIKKWSEESELSLKIIEEYLVFGFTKAKNEMYQNIVATIKKMIGE
ncbi:ATP-dependent nuclease [Blautia obeum]|uniref:ATP-dependent nuclease n=1 Tax=Blautia obeum TaxID=40520 RepID=UPI00321A8F38